MDIGYARVSTARQSLDAQLDRLAEAGIEKVFTDKRSGKNTDRPGLAELLEYARGGDVLVVTKLDRLGRNLRETLNLFHELPERGIAIRTLDDPLIIDTAADDAMSKVSVALLGLFAEMERVYMLERTERARAAALERDVTPGRKRKLDPETIERAVYLRDVKNHSMAEVAEKTGVSVATLYRRLPPRPAE
jgi:DNA invertase Pin-like site-specific DNA recombinase